MSRLIPQPSFPGLTRKSIRRWLLLFFIALAIPTAVLIQQAYSELKWESFHQYRLQAEELATRIDAHFVKLIDAEEARSFADYSFLNVAGDAAANFLQRSPLSAYPVEPAIPGLVGYFQVDARGKFSTPVLPLDDSSATGYGISANELLQRTQLASRIQKILNENQLVKNEESAAPIPRAPAAYTKRRTKQQPDEFAGRSKLPSVLADKDMSMEKDMSRELSAGIVASGFRQQPTKQQPRAQAAFDQLKGAPASGKLQKKKGAGKLGRVEDLKLDYRYQTESADQLLNLPASKLMPKKNIRKERSALPETIHPAVNLEEGEAGAEKLSYIRIQAFESEIDRFQTSLLESGHFVLFRKVWRDGQRYIQGALIEQQPMLDELIGHAFQDTALSQMSDLIVAYQERIYQVFNGQPSSDYLSRTRQLSGAVLHQVHLSAPLSELELIFNIRHLPAGPGASVITWVAAVLIMVLCAGFYLLYRLAARQIDLVQQQQNFVSAVSHELKTPLTSIRMYGELLREGWASDAQKKTYYDYIYDESERLSRLINNVLQLARMTRNGPGTNLKNVSVAEIMDHIRSKVASQIEHAGYQLNFSCQPKAMQAVVRIDTDYFTQVFINLVDNAIKFSAAANIKEIHISCQLERDGKLLFRVRDFGPGVSREQMKKIFRLFYRSGNELTRETVGTGIGLALVQQLVLAMHGEVDVINKMPGAEFRVRLVSKSK